MSAAVPLVLLGQKGFHIAGLNSPDWDPAITNKLKKLPGGDDVVPDRPRTELVCGEILPKFRQPSFDVIQGRVLSLNRST